MTKLEQKLLELGYKQDFPDYLYKKYIQEFVLSIDTLNLSNSKMFISYFTYSFNSQQQIDNLQQAFNQLQNDLKELKECEEE